MRFVSTVAALLVVSTSAFAQFPNQYLRLQGDPQHGYIEIPADTALDTPQMTVEAWVSVQDPRGGACSSIAGNGYTTGWWLGVCGTSMRSYFNGTASVKTGGTIPVAPTTWIHIAAVTDGTTRSHYINGNLVFSQAETAPRSTSTGNVRIGSDPDYDYMAAGRIDDLRIWKVARTQDQIRQTMYARYVPEVNDVAGVFAGLEAWYRFEGDGHDSWHGHHGNINGTGTGFEAATSPENSNQYLTMQGVPQHGYIEIPADTHLDTPLMTVEAWVSVSDAHGTACSSIAGNGYTTGWWLGVWGTSMRSYFNGSASQKTGGTIPNAPSTWIHIAAVTDGTTRSHYINGNLVFSAVETAPRSTSTGNVRIGSDPDYDYMPAGRIDDLRIWSVARTQEQIRQTIFALYVPESTDLFQGLEAWYRFEGDGMDSWHTHHGTINGTGTGFGTGLVFVLPKRRGATH